MAEVGRYVSSGWYDIWKSLKSLWTSPSGKGLPNKDLRWSLSGQSTASSLHYPWTTWQSGDAVPFETSREWGETSIHKEAGWTNISQMTRLTAEDPELGVSLNGASGWLVVCRWSRQCLCLQEGFQSPSWSQPTTISPTCYFFLPLVDFEMEIYNHHMRRLWKDIQVGSWVRGVFLRFGDFISHPLVYMCTFQFVWCELTYLPDFTKYQLTNRGIVSLLYYLGFSNSFLRWILFFWCPPSIVPSYASDDSKWYHPLKIHSLYHQGALSTIHENWFFLFYFDGT
jgi:hypothetical protein